LGSLFLVLY